MASLYPHPDCQTRQLCCTNELSDPALMTTARHLLCLAAVPQSHSVTLTN